ncbi:MAG TPA: NAD(P)H-dependent oxidoreductase [Stackebrandtia sp.]|uniref:NAD(P)H-dependent oxidoreductase n=1 Tax=Stackebrandtia sp. TaxID=2023065 RepID=UPI002D64C424|nr:NAD(P)H-dependent oxidoreductase [Stackebrandtia sp.]HZE41273.1 NAD(P)H-dependent oxidoreductase [Stackebrandtia sp.]
MKVLWIYAHPEPRSLNGSLRDEGIATLRELGHDVRQSDLHAMAWNPVVSPDDFTAHTDERLVVGEAQERAHATGTLSADIRAEQEKVEWADALVVQFPLWWFGMPAILKGWFDRVFTQGFAFGVANPETGRQRRYGDNTLYGKRAMVITTFGARAASMGPRGIHGDIDDLLFPLHHGILWYSGIAALEPFVVDGTARFGDTEYALHVKRLRERLENLDGDPAIAYRHQEGGDYDADLTLRHDIATSQYGFEIHRTDRPVTHRDSVAPKQE